MVPLEVTYSTSATFGYPNTHHQQENNLKSNLKKIIQAYKKQINESRKDVQELKTGERNV